MDFDKTYPKQDEKKATEGVWQPMGADFEVLVAKSGNKRFLDLAKKVFRPHRVSAQRGTLTPDEVAALTAKVMASTILLGWRGNATFGGKPVGDYSPARAEELLTAYPGFREDIAKMAEDLAPYADEQEGLELELGNSSSTSVGSSGGASSSK